VVRAREQLGTPVALEHERLEQSSLFGRRDFMARTGLWALLAALGGGVAIMLRTFWPRRGGRTGLGILAGLPSDYPIGQVSDRLVAEHQIWILRQPDGLLAFSAQCPHLGCRLRFTSATAGFHCMCHGSSFDLDGNVLRGPAARSMERVYIGSTKEGYLLVDPSIRYRKEHGEWSAPGAFFRYPRKRKR
jgi:Rieske Fe-S protein